MKITIILTVLDSLIELSPGCPFPSYPRPPSSGKQSSPVQSEKHQTASIIQLIFRETLHHLTQKYVAAHQIRLGNSPVSAWFPPSSVPERQRGCQRCFLGRSAAEATGLSWTLGHSFHSGTLSGWSASSCYLDAATHRHEKGEERKKIQQLKHLKIKYWKEARSHKWEVLPSIPH